ncbi:uncharacterized protein KQ657_004427 [Scheffersomyces spartinae]|uniref:Mitochondrial fission process protein 1 n=1 Tax=Scheffersomyces spartinae TaxID=45513 RepID=A0A9P7VBH9_9ASCO|nr:uncharacterized protein KQ657_004427 [Scheffersomyces spartinae]KAG7194748.1 hypothetical protein KQ657_004427 [Scheffersomyces spartinae]
MSGKSPSSATTQVIEAHETDAAQESPLRYAAYARRMQTIMKAAHRYVAYTSDIGELFRPVAHPRVVTAGYAISWAYILGDVGYTMWKTNLLSKGLYTPGLLPWQSSPKVADPVQAAEFQKEYGHSIVESDWRLVGLKRGIFQSIASMGLPAFTIHSTVRYSSLLFKNSSIAPLKSYGPIALGLAVVPLLPYIFDEPVEKAVDWIFEKGEEWYEGTTTSKKLQ